MKDEDVCCPRFDPIIWDNKLLEWNNKKFITTKLASFFYIPIGFGKAMTKLTKCIDNAGANFEDALCLSNTTSKWNMNLYLAVNKEIPGAKNLTLSGNFYSKVYEGSYKNIGKWMEDFSNAIKENGYEQKKIYMWYTTCPKCAKKYGKNYVVFISKI
ncbi:MAG: hypothetical protein PHD15_02675 [Clostridia bacterium]|nr:hypothetical protein [Clostridia bacterium]MDD4386652.1 hypothetical protein [Clostridia bacterium]